MKDKAKELSEYDRWLLFQTRQDSNFCFCSDIADHLQGWLKRIVRKLNLKSWIRPMMQFLTTC